MIGQPPILLTVWWRANGPAEYRFWTRRQAEIHRDTMEEFYGDRIIKFEIGG